MPGNIGSCFNTGLTIRSYHLVYIRSPVPQHNNVHDCGCRVPCGIGEGTHADIPGGVAMRTARPRALWLAALYVGLVGIIHSAASAQQRDELVASLLLPTLPTSQPPAPPPPPPIHISTMFPGITIISPSAFAADGWTVF